MPTTVPIANPSELGIALRSVRKQQRLRQDELGALSHSFVGEVESGKPTAQVGKLFELMRELGVSLHLETPAAVAPARKPRTRRQKTSSK